MKKIICILLLILCYACSSSDDGSANNNTSTLEVNVTADSPTASVDQIVTLTATANESISEIRFSRDGGATFPFGRGGELGTTVNLYFTWDTLGTKSIVVRVINNEGDMVDTTINITIERGDAVLLQSLQLTSFFDMGSTWDSEYSATDPNRLADVFFVIIKPVTNVYEGTRTTFAQDAQWYWSAIKENEDNLYWDLQSEDLYINPTELSAYIAFVDADEGTNVQDLMLGAGERLIPFGNHFLSQPSTFTVSEADINLEYVIGLDW